MLAVAYFLTAFFTDRQLFGTDYLGAALPVHEFVTGQIAAGELPYWIPHLFGGVPTHANPGSTWYPLWRLFALLLPVPRVLPAVLTVQFALAYEPDEFAGALRSLAEGDVDLDPLVTGTVGIDDVPQAFADLAHPDAHAKILVQP